MIPNLALIAFKGGILFILQLYFKIELLKFRIIHDMDQNLMLIIMKEGLVKYQEELD